MIDLLAGITAVITLQAGYNAAVVVLGVTCLGVAAGLIGTFAFLRRRALLSDALSHATLPGVALAFLIGAAAGIERSLPLLLTGAAATGVLGLLTVQFIARRTRINEDAAIGIVLSVFYGVGIVLLSYIQSLSVGGQAGLKTFILGQTAAMRRDEAVGVAILAVGAAAAAILLFKEFRLVCFDPAFAESQGWPVSRIDLLMSGLTVVVTVIGLQTVGLILIVALLILPPVAARFWANRLSIILIVSAVFGGVSGLVGAALSATLPDVPTGAIIVLVAGMLFVVSMVCAPQRGILAIALRQLTSRLRLAECQALANLHERPGRATQAWPVTMRLRLRGLVDAAGRLTANGRQAAIEAERNLRLWRLALQVAGDSLPRDVHWGVDSIDVLPRDLLAQLETASPRPARGGARA